MILLGITITSFAQRGQGQKRGTMSEGPYQGECVIPDLTEEQQQQIKTLRMNNNSQMQDYQAERRILRAELDALTRGSSYDTKAATKKIDAITSLKNKMMKQRMEHRDEIRELLTDEQKMIFDQRKAKRGKGFKSGNYHHKNCDQPGAGEGYGRYGGQGPRY
ncbi:MAG: Spy/CpxP family protein refolding chaperone [Bacteroidales bacterium]|nr:Spy/CpxP family protein refolding chaperone [Bacteroidales bacterium]